MGISKPDPRLAACRCPACDAPNNAATCIEGDASIPSIGDFSICFYCGTPLVYRMRDGALILGNMRAAERREAMAIEGFADALDLWKQTIAKRRH